MSPNQRRASKERFLHLQQPALRFPTSVQVSLNAAAERVFKAAVRIWTYKSKPVAHRSSRSSYLGEMTQVSTSVGSLGDFFRYSAATKMKFYQLWIRYVTWLTVWEESSRQSGRCWTSVGTSAWIWQPPTDASHCRYLAFSVITGIISTAEQSPTHTC